ncbi:uncharacterized protein LOC115877379 isoform X2 [Sitophilus oryzae]|uniref:Uncharacterized protein LOC115877379 isoform X2 n=1 Tax=Sitophilus oryzae TaxID=7048 RepID=A0A6J2XEL3_SITOR|nr:uncharacterized protein LOC115877379 isoform X2 [Sitophilus oryzae]
MAEASTHTLVSKATLAKIISIILVAVDCSRAAPSYNTDLWSNPCSNHLVRQVRSTADKELNFFITTVKKSMFKELKNLYPKNLKKVKGNCPRLNKLINPIKNTENFTIANQNFYKSMVELYVYLDRLKDLKITTNAQFNFDKRRSIYEDTKNTLRLTICEFNDTIRKQLKVPNMFDASKQPTVKTGCLPKEADLSKVQMLDLQFFDKLMRFFKQGKRHLKKLKRNNRGNSRVNGGKKHRT